MSIIPQSLDAHVFIVFEISMSLAFCRGTGNFGKKMKKCLAILLLISISPENLKKIYSAISEKCCGPKKGG